MNPAQELWWRQSQSDHVIFVRLRRIGAHPCHLLHYLQMATEKFSKAYLWRTGRVPPRSHAGFVRFLRALLDRRSAELDRIAPALGFGRAENLEGWVSSVLPLAYSLQNLAPPRLETAQTPSTPGRTKIRPPGPAVTIFSCGKRWPAVDRGGS